VNEKNKIRKREMLISFVNVIVVWEVLDVIFIDFGGNSKCFEAFFIDVKEVRREWDGFSCEVWK
jgi:hypothetical protein